jgi:hypothetical protein
LIGQRAAQLYDLRFDHTYGRLHHCVLAARLIAGTSYHLEGRVNRLERVRKKFLCCDKRISGIRQDKRFKSLKLKVEFRSSKDLSLCWECVSRASNCVRPSYN